VHFRVNNIREYFIDALKNERFVTDKTGVKTIELVGASFIADKPTIFGEINENYVQRELDWYKSQSLNVYDIPGGPPSIWKQVADHTGMINSNYGWCIWSADNHSQYKNVCNELMQNPNSRRATMIYTRPRMWKDYNFNNRSDFMCTNAVQYLIRDGALDVVVQMRSNDVVYGYRNDYAWQEYVQVELAHELGVMLGNIYWNVGSLHIYSRHFDLVK
jgi:thymidylate synthase